MRRSSETRETDKLKKEEAAMCPELFGMPTDKRRLVSAAVLLAMASSVSPQPCIASRSLLDASSAPLPTFLEQANDAGYTKFLRFDRRTFGALLAVFSEEAKHVSLYPPRGARPAKPRPSARALSDDVWLAMVLRFLASGISADDQLLHLGVVASTRSTYLRVGILTLQAALRKFPPASISMPSVAEARQIAAEVQRCWAPQLSGCFGAIDGSVHRKERKSDDQL
jgi:hypothetical protein